MAHPPAEAVGWAIEVWRPGAPLLGVRDLHDGRGPWLISVGRSESVDRAVLRVASQMKPPEYLQIEAAALVLAERSGLRAPRLIAIDDDRKSGWTVSLQTVLAGEPIASQDFTSGHYTSQAYGRRELLLAAGAHLAEVHRVRPDPVSTLPELSRSLERGGGYTLEKQRSAQHPTERTRAGARLLAEAVQQLARYPQPRVEPRLVHGDAWPGNIMASDGEVTGLIDWGCAGVGHPGIDLGHARLDAAMFLYGLPAADDILAGWEQASGRSADSMPYWDVVAALETAPDMGGSTDIRDRFLRTALDHLG